MATDVRTIKFTNVVKEQLFNGAEFVKKAVNHSSYIRDLTVEIPIAGSLPDVVVDRSSFPIAVTTRTDTKQSYNIKEYSVGTLKLAEKDMKELSYDKAKSIIKGHVDALNDRIGLDGAYNWGASLAANQVRTSGTATANIAPPDGTGNRKSLKLTDLAIAAKILDKQKISKNVKRYCLMSSDMYWDFVRENYTELQNYNYNFANNVNSDISTGQSALIYGFNIMQRAETLVYTNDSTPVKKAVGAVGATTDNWAAICWQEDEVAYAYGSPKLYLETNSATFQGDLLSGTQRFNNTTMRTDETGLVTIVQAAG